MIHRIALGTVQFGLRYGVANQDGQVTREEATRILSIARSNRIDTLDTAIAYGDSEQVLGQIGIHERRVISKLPAIPQDCTDVTSWARAQIEASLHRLGLSSMQGLLLHRPDQLLSKQGALLYRSLMDIKAEGLVKQLGISIYQPQELDGLLSAMDFDIVQAPFNVLDRRMITSGWMERLQSRGIELHVRSIFLQGLMLMSPEQRPAYFDRWSMLWADWDSWLRHHSLTPVQACLRYALSQQAISRVVVGVDSSTQLLEIISAAQGSLPSLPDHLNCQDIELLNPATWRLQ